MSVLLLLVLACAGGEDTGAIPNIEDTDASGYPDDATFEGWAWQINEGGEVPEDGIAPVCFILDDSKATFWWDDGGDWDNWGSWTFIAEGEYEVGTMSWAVTDGDPVLPSDPWWSVYTTEGGGVHAEFDVFPCELERPEDADA